MLSWFKKRIAAKMEALADAGQLITYLELLKQYGRSDDVHVAKAAAAANYLFGKDPDSVHAQQFDLEGLHSEAREWLKKNEPYRRLVVQSLRVRNVAAHASSGSSKLIGESVLSQFGAEFPEAPDPQSFEQLIRRMGETLPQDQRERIRAWLPK